jgi:hypothetical protein
MIDDLLLLFRPGVVFSGVGGSSLSFLVQCTLLAVICDLPGYRKVAGFAGHSSEQHMCAFCKLPASQKTDFNVSNWPQWTRDEYVAAGERWLNASNQEARERIFAETGVRWSELMRLPYWDPFKHGVVDAMHNLFLGNAQRHCRYLWGMDRSVSPNKRIEPHSTEEQSRELQKAVKAIGEGDTVALARLRRTYLATIAHDNAVYVQSKGKSPTKAEYASALVNWVIFVLEPE